MNNLNSGLLVNGNERVLHIPQKLQDWSYTITFSLESYPGDVDMREEKLIAMMNCDRDVNEISLPLIYIYVCVCVCVCVLSWAAVFHLRMFD